MFDRAVVSFVKRFDGAIAKQGCSQRGGDPPHPNDMLPRTAKN